MNRPFNKRELREAVRQACERDRRQLDERVKNGPEPAFSEEFQQKMEELIREEKHLRKRGKKKRRFYLLLAAAIILMSSMTLLAVEPLRVKIKESIATLFQDRMIVTPESEKEEESHEEGRLYRPTDLPRGYEETAWEYDPDFDSQYIAYQKKKDRIIFERYHPEGTVHQYTSDGKTMEKIKVQGCDGVYTTDQKYGTIVFEKDDQTFSITGPLRKKKLKKIAESISKEEKTFANTISASSTIAFHGSEAVTKARIDCRKKAKIRITMRLQKKKPDESWSTIKTWNARTKGKEATMKRSYKDLEPGTYRISATFHAGKEGTTANSSAIIKK